MKYLIKILIVTISTALLIACSEEKEVELVYSNKGNSSYRVILGKELLKLPEFSSEDYRRIMFDSFSEHSEYILYETDVVFDKDLNLDNIKGYAGVVVIGNLDVKESIIKFSDDGAIHLFVTGKANAKNLIITDGVYHFAGLTVSNISLVQPYIGEININNFESKILITNEYYSGIESSEKFKFYFEFDNEKDNKYLEQLLVKHYSKNTEHLVENKIGSFLIKDPKLIKDFTEEIRNNF